MKVVTCIIYPIFTNNNKNIFISVSFAVLTLNLMHTSKNGNKQSFYDA